MLFRSIQRELGLEADGAIKRGFLFIRQGLPDTRVESYEIGTVLQADKLIQAGDKTRAVGSKHQGHADGGTRTQFENAFAGNSRGGPSGIAEVLPVNALDLLHICRDLACG